MIKSIYKKILSEKKRNSLRVFIQKLIYPIYLGNNYDCNCCGKSFRKFLPKGNIKRLNAKCPYCFSLERVRLLDLYLTKEVALYEKKGIKVLHFAPEDILFKKISALEIEYIDGDINPANASHIIDITNIPFPDNYFDLIICSHVLGHIPDEPAAIKELYRVLGKDGQALIMTLINPQKSTTFEDSKIKNAEERLKIYGESDLCRLHGLDFPQRLQNQGFSVDKIDFRKSLSEEIVKRNSLGDGTRELIFKCTKN